MSTVYATYTGFVGMGDGKTATLEHGAAFDLTDPVVQAHPELFTARAPGTAEPAEVERPAEPGAEDQPAVEQEPAAKPSQTITSANSPRPSRRKAAK